MAMLNTGELLGREGSSGKAAEGLGALVVVRTRLSKLSIHSKICVVSLGSWVPQWFCWVFCGNGRGWAGLVESGEATRDVRQSKLMSGGVVKVIVVAG